MSQRDEAVSQRDKVQEALEQSQKDCSELQTQVKKHAAAVESERTCRIKWEGRFYDVLETKAKLEEHIRDLRCGPRRA